MYIAQRMSSPFIYCKLSLDKDRKLSDYNGCIVLDGGGSMAKVDGNEYEDISGIFNKHSRDIVVIAVPNDDEFHKRIVGYTEELVEKTAQFD